MAILDEDNLNRANSTLTFYNEREALKRVGHSGDAPDAISRWARSLPLETSEAAFKDFMTRSFSGTPPQSVEEKDLLEWAISHLRMQSEFDMALGNHLAEFEKEGRLTTFQSLYVFDSLEPFTYNLVEDDAEAPMGH
jgi:antirestriction protein